MTSLAPPSPSSQRSYSSTSSASRYSTPEYEITDPQESEQSDPLAMVQYCIQKRQTVYVQSGVPPEQWNTNTRRMIEGQLSSAPEEVSTLIHSTNTSRRAQSWNEEDGTEVLKQLEDSLSPHISRSLSSSPISISPRGKTSKPLACMPGMKDLSNSNSMMSAIRSMQQKPPSPTRRRPIRRRIYFYNRDEPYYGFTNFSPHEVKYKGKVYPTSEHLFQSFKFQDHKPMLAEHIRLFSDRPSVAFSEARRFQPEVRPDWKEINIKKMDETLWHKFNQHEDLKQELLSTGDDELIEDSDRDSFWGIGADRRGRNELGKALERLRDRLRSEMT